MAQYSFALYDAFTDKPFAGSQAAIVPDASSLDQNIRTQIAREIGFPATVFIDAVGDDWLEVQFLSTVMELPMCGHGSICLMTHLVESGLMQIEPGVMKSVELRLAKSRAIVELLLSPSGKIQVMLDVTPAKLEDAPGDIARLAGLLGLEISDFDRELPLQVARGDFVHLVVPLKGMKAIQKVSPNFTGIIEYCHEFNIETVIVFSQQTESVLSTIRVRDFCPAVGVPESAAAGTSNAALSNYLLQNNLIEIPQSGKVEVIAEQGYEINRPSEITTIMTMQNDTMTRLQVGGVATRVLQGELLL